MSTPSLARRLFAGAIRAAASELAQGEPESSRAFPFLACGLVAAAIGLGIVLDLRSRVRLLSNRVAAVQEKLGGDLDEDSGERRKAAVRGVEGGTCRANAAGDVVRVVHHVDTNNRPSWWTLTGVAGKAPSALPWSPEEIVQVFPIALKGEPA